MKSYFLSFLILFLFYTVLFADEIHLQDGIIIKGKIIQLTEKHIEYDPEGGRPFDLCPRGQVKKIVYDDGRVVRSSFRDKIFFNDGTIVKCSIDKVTDEKIFYYAMDSQKKDSVNRTDVAKMTFGSDKTITISEGEEPEVDNNKIHSGGFLDSTLWIGIFGGFGELVNNGEIEKNENRFFDLYSDDLAAEDIVIGKTRYNIYSGGIDADLLLLTIKDPQSRGFDYTGVSFGIKSRYTSMSIDQVTEVDNDLNDNSEEYTYVNAKLLKYKSLGAGPELNIVFSPRGNSFNMVAHTYLIYEYVYEGSLSTAPALRKIGMPIGESAYSKLGGSCVTFGTGLHFVLNRWLPVTAGLNFRYSFINLNLDNAVPVYNDGDKNIQSNNFGVEFALGIHVF